MIKDYLYKRNKSLREYINESINESMKKKVGKNNLNVMVLNPNDDVPNDDVPNIINGLFFVGFIFIASLLFYHREKLHIKKI
jgi:hypothetical protein